MILRWNFSLYNAASSSRSTIVSNTSETNSVPTFLYTYSAFALSNFENCKIFNISQATRHQKGSTAKSAHKVFFWEIDVASFTHLQSGKLLAKAYEWNGEHKTRLRESTRTVVSNTRYTLKPCYLLSPMPKKQLTSQPLCNWRLLFFDFGDNSIMVSLATKSIGQFLTRLGIAVEN